MGKKVTFIAMNMSQKWVRPSPSSSIRPKTFGHQ